MGRAGIAWVTAAAALALALGGCGGGGKEASGEGATASGAGLQVSKGKHPGEAAAKRRGKSSLVRPFGAVELPAADEGCGEASEGGDGATTVPVKVTPVGGGVGVLVNVCIGKKGPFPFVVDSGAPTTVVSARLAGELKLPAVAGSRGWVREGEWTDQASRLEGECRARSWSVRLPAWSVAGAPLRPQTAVLLGGPRYDASTGLDGSLGADVLSSFGAVRIDYEDETMSLAGPGGAGSMAEGEAAIAAPMRVLKGPAGVGQRVPVKLSGGRRQGWSVDTGSWFSYVQFENSKRVGLGLTGKVVEERTICANPAILTVKSGPWRLAGRSLNPQALGSTPFVAIPGRAGLLGSSTLSEYGSVLIDWSDGKLLLGAE